jgi:probable phosphoglycerate mutase
MPRRLRVEADGGSRGNPGPAGYGAVVRDAETGELLREIAASIGKATNNVAEYRGLLAGLAAARELDPSSVEVAMDSKLVVEQMSGRWKVKHPDMRELAAEAAALVRSLPSVSFRHIPREQNSHADRLANEAMDAAARGLEWTPSVAAAPAPAAPAPSSASVAGGRGATGWSAPAGPPTTTWLLRHGQTSLSVEKRFSGTGDPDLNELGVAQAQATAVRIAAAGGIDAVVSSPLKRAFATAAAAADALGLEVMVEDDLRETDFGDWEGYTFAEIRRRWPDEMAAWMASPDVAPPGGESFTATATRVLAARDRVVSTFPGQSVLLVSPVTPIKTLVRAALDAPPVALYRLYLDLACLSVVDWQAGGAGVVRLFNDTSHLAGLLA